MTPKPTRVIHDEIVLVLKTTTSHKLMWHTPHQGPENDDLMLRYLSTPGVNQPI